MKTIWSKISLGDAKMGNKSMSNMTEVLRMGYKENEMVIHGKKKFVFFFF